MLRITGLSHSYGTTTVLKDVSFTAPEGKMVGLIGPNGSGKTTLLRCLYGAITPDRGQVFLAGQSIATLSPRAIAQQIAVVIQEPPGDLIQTVADLVLMGRTPHMGLSRKHTDAEHSLAVAALTKMGMLHLAHRGMNELSGGERQRVLIARALVQEARMFLLDEPTNHLDIGYQHQILDLVRTLGLTTVVVLHDLNLAARYCDELVLLSEGQVRAWGPSETVLTAGNLKDVYHVDAEEVIGSDHTRQLLFHGRGADQNLT